jgi:hypothetical protein
MARRGHKCRCCEDDFCLVADGKPRTDPVNEGTWVPDAVWTDSVVSSFPLTSTRRYNSVTNVSSWTFVPREQAGPGNTWFFYGSRLTSAPGRPATLAEQYDWGNICNWYSSKTSEPPNAFPIASSFRGVFPKRAKRLPPSDAVVHIYTPFTTDRVGPQTVRNAYIWDGLSSTYLSYELNATQPFPQVSEIEASVLFRGQNASVALPNTGTINGGALFFEASNGFGILAGGTINGSAMFVGNLPNVANLGIVNGDAWFYGGTTNSAMFLQNNATVTGDAYFFDFARNILNVEGSAEFFDNSQNDVFGRVGGTATFNDAACSQARSGFIDPMTEECFLFFGTNNDDPTSVICNGSAPKACDNIFNNCGCG